MLQVEQAIFLFLPFTSNIPGYVMSQMMQKYPFYLLHNIFSEGSGPRCFWDHEGPPLDMPLCGVERSGSES